MYRNPKLLVACRQLSCQLCETEDGTVVAAHSNQLADGKGKGNTRWAHFRGPDGNVYEFVHHPSIATGGKPE